MNSINFTQVFWLFITFLICTVLSFILCALARTLFPTFRSGEHKPGTHRADLPTTGRSIKTIELPLVGGPAFILAIIGTGVIAGYLFHLERDQWTLLLISLGATLGYGVVGFLDDWRKVYRNQGLSESQKFAGVFLISIIAATCYFFLSPAGRQSYSFWKDLPILNTLLCSHPTLAPVCTVTFPQASYFFWLLFLLLLTGCTGTATSVAVDFSDGFDGLAGGLVFSAALAMAIAVTGLLVIKPDGVVVNPEGVVLEVLALACAGGVLGFLPWNWPSSWAARRSATVKRRAKIYMGDSGALGLGGLLAMIAIFSRNEFLLLTTIGGVFVLEGLSVIVSTRVLTPFFRGRLKSLRFEGTKEFVPHTDFPLPFLATPLHHHFDLLGWDRKRLVYGAWVLGAIFAVLSVMVSIDTITWQRYLARFLALVLMMVIWSSGTWSKNYFVGKQANERMRHRRLALYYGYPYKIMGMRLFHHVESIEASEDVIETPAEELALWQRMTIFDARAMLGLYCYRAGYFPAALAQWSRIPERNRVLRPEIMHLYEEVENRLALETQQTQPMKRDQIMRKLQPQQILMGNLPPADMPNPHEPIREEEVENRRTNPWSTLVSDKDDENATSTPPLK
jgi:UDP-N-acetylmuramyl pentapeptide phosphotransferase/UDP-N-acetylglucosamine-1-phosphate transferase